MIQNFCKNVSFGSKGYAYLYNTKKSNIVLISGNNSNHRYLKDKIKKINNGKIIHFTLKNERNSLEYIKKLSKKLNNINISFLLVLGGGSIIDFSKRLFKKLNKSVKFVIFPSVIGSGAETSISSIINTKNNKNIIVNNKFLPDAVIYDENLIKSCKETQILMGLLDAVTHNIESILTFNANPYLSFLSKYTIDYFIDNFSQILNKNKKLINYKILSIISFNGGLAQSNAGSAICHALAHSAEIITKENHSKCISFFIIATLNYYSIKNKYQLKKLNPKIIFCIKKIVKRLETKISFSKLKNILKNQRKFNELLKIASKDPCWKLYEKNININLLKKCLI